MQQNRNKTRRLWTALGLLAGAALIAVGRPAQAQTDRLQLTIAPRTFAETAGANAATATVARTSTTAGPITVLLSSSDETEVFVPGSIVIPTGAESVSFPVSAVDDNGVDGAQQVTITASRPGMQSSSTTVVVTDNDVRPRPTPTAPPRLSVSIEPSTIGENGGRNAAVGRITRSVVTSAAYTVNLTSSDTTEILVPGSVILPSGVASVTFPVSAVDDTIVDGTQHVRIVAGRPGFVSGVATVAVLDDEGNTAQPALGVTISPSSFSEAAGSNAATGTVFRRGGPAVAYTVLLASSDTSEVRVPASVTLPAGANAVNFPVAAIDDAVADDVQTVNITASRPGFLSATASVRVTDDDGPPPAGTLSLSIDEASIREDDGPETATGTVTREGANNDIPYTILLASSDTSEATVPASVTILAGDASANFPISAVDDSIADGDQKVRIVARKPGLTPAAADLIVTDNEVGPRPNSLRVSFLPPNISETGRSVGTVTRTGPTDAAILVSLQSSDLTEARVNSGVVIPAGAASATFSVVAVDDSIVDGNQPVTISATAAGLQSGSGLIVIDDDDGGKSIGQAASRVRLSTATARAADESIRLTLDGALDADAVGEVARYRVTVNGTAVAVEGVVYEGSANSILLLLPEGAVTTGDEVAVVWSGLRDAGGRAVSGQVVVMAR